MNLGEKIKSARKAAGLTLLELEARSEIANSTISRIENGKTDPERKTLVALSKALGNDFGLDWLTEHVHGSDPTPSKKEIAKELTVEQLISLKFGGGGETRSKADMRALARMLDEAIAKEERIMNYPERKK
jgi:transcriptional regulator with XRE-family HTH domain